MSSPRSAPIYTWDEKPGPSRIEEEEKDRRPPEEEEVEETVPVPATSVPTGEESLPSAEDSLAVAREALRFVQSFVRNPRQETEEKLLFAEKLGAICEAETIDGFHLFRDQLLSEAVQVLIPWTASPSIVERERATQQLARICDGPRTRSGFKETRAFPTMGPLVGCLALCHFDDSALVAQQAADGLICIYRFAACSQADLWRTLVSFHYNAVGALNHLLTHLLGDPQEPPASEEEAFALGLVAAEVLAELLRKPPGVFSTTLHDRWSVAWIAVVLWVSRLHSHQASHGATARQPPQSSPPSVWLARSAVWTLERPLLRVCPEAIPHKVSWELLTDAETFLDGVSLLTRKGGGVGKDRAVGPTRLLLRAMQEWLFADHLKMASFVAAVLDDPDHHHYPGTALTILVERRSYIQLSWTPTQMHTSVPSPLDYRNTLRKKGVPQKSAQSTREWQLLRHPSTHPLTDWVLAHLRRHLTSSDAALHSLALDGLLHMAESPKKVRNPRASLLEAMHKLLPLLPQVLSSLQEADHLKAQSLLDHLHVWLQKETSPPVAAEVAGHMPPRLEGLVPILLHLRDDSPTVVEASWNILHRLAVIMGHRELEPVLQKQKETSAFLATVKQFHKVPACHFLPQVLNHLSSPLANTREAAVRMLVEAASLRAEVVEDLWKEV
ncbi:UNVERIFIED_CONTAM: hypothetical protein K2H54_006859 [Gekko kuhli]